MNTLSFLSSTLQRCFVAVLFFCGLPASAADTVRSTEIVAVELNHRFVISTPGICEQLSSDQYAKVELRIQGELTPLKPMDCNPAATGYGLQFFMPQLDGSDLGAMRELLVGSPWKDAKHGFRRDLPYSLTLNTAVGGGVLVSGMLRLQVLRPAYLLLGFGFILGVGFALLRLGRDSGLLRDVTDLAVRSRSFSLSRVQMAWWFFIVFASYMWLWLVGEGIPTLSSQALGLLGIGSATYFAAASVDATKPPVSSESQGFWSDILSDAQGLALYRFQMLVFNLLFGVLFILYVVQHVSMPEFDGNILTLMGMSAGTYAGFKIPEKTQNTPVAMASAASVADVSDDPKKAYSAGA